MSNRKRQKRKQNQSVAPAQTAKIIEQGLYNPFTDRDKENFFTLITKYVMNFLIALIQVLNVPALIASILSLTTNVPHMPTITWQPTWSIAWLALIWLLLFLVFKQSMINITSRQINIVWAVNFVGTVKNPFYSKQVTKEIHNDLSKYLAETEQINIKEAVSGYEQDVEELRKHIERVEKTSSFPQEFFDAIVRMVDLITHVVKEPQNERYHAQALLDKLLSEICSSSSVPGAHQASIMCPDDKDVLRIIGSVNIKESVVKNRRVDAGNGFVGKVYKEGKSVWINNLDSPEAKEFGFDANKARPYKAILGFPIKQLSQTGNKTIGVIAVHFRDEINFSEGEKKKIMKLLEVVGHFVVFIFSHREFHKNVSDVILGIRGDGIHGQEIAATDSGDIED